MENSTLSELLYDAIWIESNDKSENLFLLFYKKLWQISGLNKKDFMSIFKDEPKAVLNFAAKIQNII